MRSSCRKYDLPDHMTVSIPMNEGETILISTNFLSYQSLIFRPVELFRTIPTQFIINGTHYTSCFSVSRVVYFYYFFFLNRVQ